MHDAQSQTLNLSPRRPDASAHALAQSPAPAPAPNPPGVLGRQALRNLLLLAATLVALNLPGLYSCTPPAGRTASRLEVTSFRAVPGADASRPQLRLRFNGPAVPESAVGRPVLDPPAKLLPKVAVQAHWADRQTLVLTPLAPLALGKKYDVVLAGDLARRARQVRFEFVNQPLRLVGVSGVGPVLLDHLSLLPKLRLHFDREVRAADVARSCFLTERDSLWPFALETPDPKAVAKVVLVAPRAPLPKHRQLVVRCAGLTAAKGSAPLTVRHYRVLRTHGDLAVAGFAPGRKDHPPEEARVEVRFTTPVTEAEARQRIRIEPPVKGFEAGHLWYGRTRYVATVNLQPNTRYRLVVDGQLRDQFGQRLGQTKTYTFTTGRPLAELRLERGIYALEASAPGYPVWTRHLDAFNVTCAPVPQERVVKLLTSALDYDPWYSDHNVTRDVPWDTLGLAPQRASLTFADTPGTWKLHQLDLAKLCREGLGAPKGAKGAKGAKATKGGKAGPRRGLYLAEVRSAQLRPHPDYRWRYKPRQRVLANITDLGVITKIGPASGLVWVTSLATGKPVAAARVTVRRKDGTVAHRGTTDRQGRLALPGASALLKRGAGRADEAIPQRGQRLLVFVETKHDFAVVDGNWANGIQLWNFGVTVDRRPGASRVRGFLQSDRGIYRPGETVHFKGLVREVRLGALPRLPTGRTVKVSVRDPRGQALLDQARPLSPFGGFAFDLGLSGEARVGDYHVTATLGDQTFRERFQVEAFRKVTFEVKARPEERHVTAETPLRVALEARYLFGAPVAKGRVSWSVRRRPHVLRVKGLEAYHFDDRAGPGTDPWAREESGSRTEFLTDGQATLDAKGRTALVVAAGAPVAAVTVPAPGPTTPGSSAPGTAAASPGKPVRAPVPEDYVTSVTVTDPADRSVSRTVVATRHPTDRYVGLHTQEYVQAVGMPFAVNAVAVDPAGRRVALTGELHLSRVRWICKWQGSWRAYRTCQSKEEPLWRRAVSIPAAGVAVVRLTVRQPGEHLIRLTAKDRRGRPVAASGAVWVLGRGEAFWSGDESVRMSLVPSRKGYQPGDTAVLVPRTPLTGATALVTLERNGVLESFVTTVKSAAQGIRIPLAARHAPNVYATVTLVTGRRGAGDRDRPRFQMGVVELPVAIQEHRLKVAITPEKTRYEPGQRVRGTLRVTDHRGRPVRAEVSLSVADEGLLQLIAYRLPDPLRAFFAPWGIGVDSATNWNRVARLNDPNARSRDSGGDGDSDGGGAGAPRVRSNFVNSAFWAPALLTGPEGVAAFEFTAPDNLTAFRLMAVAADRGHRFGKGTRRITISKDLLIKPVLPRFLSSGDRAEIGVVVHNRTDRAGAAVVTVTAEGLTLEASRQVVILPARGSARARFLAEVPFTKAAAIQFTVRFGARADALRVSVPVQRPLALTKRALLQGRAKDQPRGAAPAAHTVPLSWSASVLPGDSHLEVTVDRTGLGELREGLRYLVEYPYGCLEQTLSRFIPLAKVKDLSTSLGFAELQGPRLRRFLKAGADKVARHQKEDGLFSLWPSGQTYPHLSAFALYGLLEAKRAGVAVDEATLKRGGTALKAWAGHRDRTLKPGGELASMALVAYVLAELGTADTGLQARLYEARRGLPTDGLAFLLRALHRSGADAALRRQVLADLLERLPNRGGVARAVEPAGSGYSPDQVHVYFASPVRSSAIALSALLETAPSHPRIDALVAGLKADRNADGRWRNTQENLYALVALADWARRQATGRTEVSLTLDGRALTSATLEGAQVLTWKKPLSALHPGALSLGLKGAANFAVRLVTATRARRSSARDRGFGLRRQYVDPATGKPLAAFKAGQLVQVRLEVTTSARRRWVAVVDRLPAGFEPVNGKLATSAKAPPAAARGRSAWWVRPSWTHRELLDDRVRAFADRLDAGTHVLTYLARATLPGAFTAAPAAAEEMYSPEVYGRGNPRRVTVQR